MKKKNLNQSFFPILIATGLVAVQVLLPSEAWAQTKKKVTVGELLRRAKDESRGGKTNPLQNKSSTALPETQFNFQKREGVNLGSVKPPRSSELLKNDNSDQGEYEKTLDAQIQELYKLTRKFKDSSNRGELWLRLAELYVEKSGLVDTRKQDEYDRQLKSFQAGTNKVKPKLDTAEAREYNRKAIQLYEWFLRDYPSDSKVSQALFFLGYNYFELSDMKKGTFYYNQLTQKFPTSPFVGEAHFALGEYYFENERWADAYKEYTKLMKDTKHRLNTFSLYKGAWCLYRLGKTEQAIQYMDFIIKGGRGQNADQSIAGKRLNTNRLENEALRDLVVFFADIGDTKRAINYFKGINTKESRNYIEKLAYFFADKGNRDASRDVFRMLITQDPSAKKAFEYQYQIVQNYFYSKNSPQFKEELYRWITDFNTGSAWYGANQADTALLQNSFKLREQTLRNYILQQHQTAQNSRAAFSQKSALDGYQLYFQEFASSPQASDMHFFYGELLYDMGKYEEASAQYTWVAENAPTSKFALKASQNILLSIEKALPKDEELQKRVGDSIEPIAMDPRVEKFIRSATWYIQKFPNSDKDAEIRFRVGRLYYQTNNFAPAEKYFREIVQKHPKTKYSEYSANLLLDIYNLKKDYAGLEKMGTELLANDSIAASKAGADIRTVLEKANFKKAQDLEVDRKYLESANQYQAFALQNPKSELVAMALFNAGVNFERAGHNPDAISNYKKVLASNDKKAETLKPKAQKLLAKLYQDSVSFEEAAKLFKDLAAKNPADPLTPNYLFNAAVLFEALGRPQEAVAAYGDFLKVNKNQNENAATLFTLAQIERKANATNSSYNHYREYTEHPVAKTEKKLEAYYWMSEFSRKSGRKKDSEENKDKALGLFKRLGNNKSAEAGFAAKLLFQHAEETYAQLKSVAIPADPAKQKKAVDAKLDLLSKLNDELLQVIKIDSAEEIVNSLNLLGEANDHMTTSILGAPVPAGLNDEQKKVYRSTLEQITDKFSKKSVESFKIAVERARDLEVYNAAYRNALNRMSQKDPVNFYNQGEIGMDSRLVNWIGEK